MGLLFDNSKKTIKAIVRSRRSVKNDFVLYAANYSKNENFVACEYTITQVVPDPGYKAQFEVFHTFTNLVIGENILALKLIGQDKIERISTYIVTRGFPHEETVIDTFTNQLPILYNPIPVPDATNVSRGTSTPPALFQLQWSVNDPEADTLTYDVFFSKSETPRLVSVRQSSAVYPLSGMILDAGTTYAWKVIIHQSAGGIVEGPKWLFRTAFAPDVPNNPLPINEAIEVNFPDITLYWETQSPESNLLSYDVYFGTSFVPPYYATTTNKWLNISLLTSNTTYYWKVIVSDNKGNIVPSPKWKFKTKA